MHPNARPTTPTTTAPTDAGPAPHRPFDLRRLLQALGGVLVVALLGFLLVTARMAHEEEARTDSPAAAAEAAPARAEATPAETTTVDPEKVLGRGEASYYHASLEGRPTASGEPYRGSRLTAAHRTLPLGSKVRVTDLGSGKAVTVRINDRGPFHGRRVIDLSHAAARQLGMVTRGTARVRLELLTS